MGINSDDILQIRKYLKGELDVRAMHRLEKRAQGDPFLMDALEGYSNRKDQQVNLEDMQRKLQKRVRKSAKKPIALWPLIAVAIAVLALILLGAWWVLFNKQQAKSVKNRSSMFIEAGPRAANIYRIGYKPLSVITESDHKQRHLVLISGIEVKSKADTIKKKADKDSNLVLTSYMPITVANGFRLITGTVKTIIGNVPIPQAIIWNKSTDRQYATDNKGAFIIEARTGDILYTGYDGFKNEKVVVGKKNKLNIELERKDASMYDAVSKGLNFNPFDDLAHPEVGWDKFRALQNKRKSPDGKIGTVKLKFTVNVDNTVSDFIVLQSLSTDADDEAIRFIRDDTKWLRNTNGKPQILTLNIKFKK